MLDPRRTLLVFSLSLLASDVVFDPDKIRECLGAVTPGEIQSAAAHVPR